MEGAGNVDKNPRKEGQDNDSPLNQEGKMIYDRDFSKPQGLPNLPDIFLDEPALMSSAKRNDMGNTVPDFTPDFFQTMSARRKVDELGKADNPLLPSRIVKGDESSDEDRRTQEIYKRVKSILNELTPQNVQPLLKQVRDLNIDTETRLKGVSDLIYEKAIGEESLSGVYANMCRYLMQLNVPSDSRPGEKVNVRDILLTKCQREFEKVRDVEIDLKAPQQKIDKAVSEDVKKQLQEEMEIAATTARRRSIGNIRFFGELFKLKMLTENIMHDCVFKLLRSRYEENLECLCTLLTTIGKEFDTEKAKRRIDQYFQKIQKIVREKKTSSRVQIMLQDVIDLRSCNWVPRREDNNPKTIDQIHKETEQTNFPLTQKLHTSDKQGPFLGRPPLNRGGPNQYIPHDGDGLNNVASKPVCDKDLTKMKITKPRKTKTKEMDHRLPLKPPSLPKLVQDGSRETWEQFEQEFDQYLVDSGLESMDDTVKCPLLRQCIGKENMHVYDSFYFEKDDDRYKLHELKKKFSHYCKRHMPGDGVKKV